VPRPAPRSAPALLAAALLAALALPARPARAQQPNAMDDAGASAPEDPGPALPAPAAATPPRAAATPAPARAAPTLAEIRSAVDAVLRAQGLALWATWTSGEKLDVAGAWKGREGVLSKEALVRVGQALAAAQGEERRALDWLRSYLAGEILAREIAEPAAKLAAARAAATFPWDRKSVPLRDATALLAAEPDALRRASIASAAGQAAARLLPLAAARDERLAAAVRTLGWDGTLALAADLRGASPDALAALADRVLARTEELHGAVLDDLARRELSLSFTALRTRDLPRLLRPMALADAFPAARAVADATAVLGGLGLELRGDHPIVLDADARPGKIGRPLAVPVDVPGDVRLSLVPSPGLDAAAALLHELGAAEAYAHATVPQLEFRRLGPPALSASWALLAEGVTASPEWLSTHGVEGDRLRETVRAAAARRLQAVRGAAARVLFEIRRAREPARAAEIWRAVSERAFGHADEELAPAVRLDPDPLLRAAEELRAELLAAQLEAHLARLAGDGPWWRSTRAGEWLRRTWAEGTRATPEERSASMGYAALDADALEALWRARCGLAAR